MQGDIAENEGTGYKDGYKNLEGVGVGTRFVRAEGGGNSWENGDVIHVQGIGEGEGKTSFWKGITLFSESSGLAYEGTAEGVKALQYVAYGREAVEIGSKTISRSIAGVNLAATIMEGVDNENGWQNHNTADVIISGAETVATFLEVSNPVGWAILGVEALWFVGNEIYKNENDGHSITEDLFD